MTDSSEDRRSESEENAPDPEEQGAADPDAASLLLENDSLRQDLDHANAARDEAERSLAELQNLARRSQAEFANYKRRTREDLKKKQARVEEDTCLGFLPVLDDLERAAAGADNALGRDPEADGPDPRKALADLAEGVRLVVQRFRKALAEHGIEEIEADGMPFDFRVHEAMLRSPAKAGERDGQIIAVFERGYRRGDRVVRHAKVIVAEGDGPDAAPGEAGEAGEAEA